MKSSEKTSKPRFAVLIDAPKLDTSYNSMGSIWELEIVRIDPGKEEPRNCARDNWDRPEERIFDDMKIRCYVSWYDGKFTAQPSGVEYRNVYSVDMNCVKILSDGLKRVGKIVESFPCQPETFGQYVCLVASGLGVKEMIRKSPHESRQCGSMYSDYQWQTLPLTSAQRVIDDLLDKEKERMFPNPVEALESVAAWSPEPATSRGCGLRRLRKCTSRQTIRQCPHC